MNPEKTYIPEQLANAEQTIALLSGLPECQEAETMQDIRNIRRKIDAVLAKITSPDLMHRIYRYIQYMYIYVQK